MTMKQAHHGLCCWSPQHRLCHAMADFTFWISLSLSPKFGL